MSGLTIAQVLRWQPAELGSAAGTLRSKATAHERGHDEADQQRSQLAGVWGGNAGPRAQETMTTELSSLSDLITWERRIAGALEDGEGMLQSAKQRVQMQVQAAEAAGLQVNTQTGQVQAPATFHPSTMTQQYKMNSLVQQHQDDINSALQAAAHASEQVAHQLTGNPFTQAYAMAALPSQGGMNFSNYDLGSNLRPAPPAEWAALLGVVGLGPCAWLGGVISHGLPGPNAAQGYWGGGLAKGPDGLEYPITISVAHQNGHVYNTDSPLSNDITTLGGRDGNWITVGQHTGVVTYGQSSGFWSKFFVVLGGAAGASYAAGMLRKNNNLLNHVEIAPDGNAVLQPHRVDSVPDQPVDDPRNNPLDPDPYKYTNPVQDGIKVPEAIAAPGTTLNSPGAFDKYLAPVAEVSSIENGVLTSQHMDDKLTHDYQIVFQQNPDGRRRAFLRLYDVWTNNQTGKSHLTSGYAAVTPDGNLVTVPQRAPRPHHPEAGPL